METNKQRLMELANIKAKVNEGVDPNFPVKLTITVKASELMDMFGGPDRLGIAGQDAQEFNRFVKVMQDDLANWFAGPGGEEWVNDGVEQGVYDDFQTDID